MNDLRGESRDDAPVTRGRVKPFHDRRAIRVGVAGCGRIARVLHIPRYESCSQANLVALYNHRLETVEDLRSAYPKVTFYDEYEDFLERSGVEAVSICTPNSLHAEMAIAALKRGIHVLVEKPMAVTLDEAQEMIEAAEESETVLTVAQIERYYPAHEKARQILEEGVLGEIFHVRTMFGHAGPLSWSPRGQWFLDPKLAGLGVIGDLAVHKVDLIRYLTHQRIDRVAAFKSYVELGEVEDNVVSVLELSRGALATLGASWTTRGGSIDDITLIGEGGSLRVRVDPGSPLVLHRASGDPLVYSVPSGIPVAKDKTLQLDLISQFVEAVLGERPNPIPPQDGYDALEACVAIELSARIGEIVRLPLPAEAR